jgi:PAS domain S-box-containing protein
MGALVRTRDWSRTPLGPIDGWSPSLRTAMSLCLGSRHPMFLWWGPSLVNLYNDAYIPILGQRHPSGLGRRARELWREVWSTVGPQVEAAMTRGEASWCERVPLVVERNGSPEEAFFTWSLSAVRDEAGAVVGVVCTVTEETRRVRIEHERDRLAAQWRLALDAATLGWWHLDPATNQVTIDARFREIFELQGEMVSNERMLARLHPQDRARVVSLASAAMNAADPQRFATDYRIVLDDGRTKWVETRGITAFDGDGEAKRATSFVGTVADITDRKRTDVLLRLNEEQLRLFVEHAPAALAMFDHDMRYLWASQRWISDLRIADRYAVGRSHYELFPEIPERWKAFHRRGLQGEVISEDADPFERQDGTTQWLKWEIRPWRDAAGAIGGIVIFAEDVTERRKAENALHAGEARFRFMAALGEQTRDLTSPDAVMATVARALGEELRVSRCAYAEVAPDSEHFTIRHDYTDRCPSSVGDYRLSLFGSRAAGDQRSGRTLVINDVDTELEPADGGDTFNAIGIKALVCCPLVRRGRLVAMMAVHQLHPRVWTPDEVLLVEAVVERSWAYIERARDQRSLALARERLEFSVSAAEVGTFFCPMPLGEIIWNDKCKEHFFLPPEATVDFDLFYSRIHEADRARTREAVEHAVYQREPYDIEYRVVAPDGRWRWIRAKGRAYYDASGNPTRFDGITIDATSLKRAEDELKDSEARFRLLADAMPQIVWVTRPDGYHEYFNRRWHEYIGLDFERTKGDQWSAPLHPEDRERARDRWQLSLSTGEPYEVEYRFRRHDGEYRWFLARALPLRDNEGNITRWYGTCTDVHDAKLGQDELLRRRQQMELVVRGANVGVWYCPLPFDRLIWDATVKDHFHLPHDAEVTIDTFYERLHPEDRERTRASIEQSIADKAPYDIEYRTTSSDGSRIKWVRAIGRGFYDAAGDPIRFDGITIDVTEKKRSELELRDSEKRFRAMADAAPAMLWITEPDGQCSFLSRGWYEFTGQTFEQGLGFGWTQAAHPDDQAAAGRAFVEAMARRMDYEIDFRLRRADGTYRWVIDAGRPRYAPDGAFLGYIGCVIDVHERKQAEQIAAHAARRQAFLVQLNDRVRPLREPAKVMAAVADMVGEHVVVSRCCYGEVDAAQAHVTIEYDFTDGTVSVRGRHRLDDFGSDLIRELQAGATVAVDDVATDARTIDALGAWNAIDTRSLVCVPLVKEGRFVALFVIHHRAPRRWTAHEVTLVEDVAERTWLAVENARASQALAALLASEQSARERAEQESRLKDEFLATLSHELRTPLNAILGWAQLIGFGTITGKDVHEGVRVIERNARVQAQLIEDLLDMSRIISGNIRLDVQPVDLASVTRDALETVRPAADAKGVRLVSIMDPLAGPVSGDPGRLQQVVWNLVHNAVKFTPRGGQIKVILERIDSHLALTVHDTGEGIRPEFLPHVFDRFRQADGSTTRRHGGLGLGLSIVRQLVELHGGSVKASSPGEGQGATFTVLVPLAALRSEATASSSAGRHPASFVPPASAGDDMPGLANVKVVVVDDDADARELVSRVLEGRGAQVIAASSAAEALQAVARERPHVLVSDIGMPGTDGYQLIHQVRQLGAAQGGTVPAVALTAFARSEDRRQAIAAGYQMHLAKPVEPVELVTVVASLAGLTARGVKAAD